MTATTPQGTAGTADVTPGAAADLAPSRSPQVAVHLQEIRELLR